MSEGPLYRIWDSKGRPLDPSPIATLTAERDAARAEVAMLSAAREANRRMLGRILGGESEASTVVLLEQVEAVLSGLRAEVAAMTDRDGDRWAEVRMIVDADSGDLDRVFNAITGRRDG